MKLALFVFLSADRREGVAVGDLQPYDAAMKQFKAAVSANSVPDGGLPLMELWTANGVMKQHRFREAAVRAPAKKRGGDAAKLKAIHADLMALEKERADLAELLKLAEAERDELTAKLEAVTAPATVASGLDLGEPGRADSDPPEGGTQELTPTVPPVASPGPIGPKLP